MNTVLTSANTLIFPGANVSIDANGDASIFYETFSNNITFSSGITLGNSTLSISNGTINMGESAMVWNVQTVTSNTSEVVFTIPTHWKGFTLHIYGAALNPNTRDIFCQVRRSGQGSYDSSNAVVRQFIGRDSTTPAWSVSASVDTLTGAQLASYTGYPNGLGVTTADIYTGYGGGRCSIVATSISWEASTGLSMYTFGNHMQTDGVIDSLRLYAYPSGNIVAGTFSIRRTA